MVWLQGSYPHVFEGTHGLYFEHHKVHLGKARGWIGMANARAMGILPSFARQQNRH